MRATVKDKLMTFRLTPEMSEALQKVWERDGVIPSEQVRRAVSAYLEQKDALRVKKLTVVGKGRRR